jgi:hypothetical protein
MSRLTSLGVPSIGGLPIAGATTGGSIRPVPGTPRIT